MEQVWAKANNKSQKEPKTTLNKELAKIQKRLTKEQKSKHVENRLDYLMKMFEE